MPDLSSRIFITRLKAIYRKCRDPGPMTMEHVLDDWSISAGLSYLRFSPSVRKYTNIWSELQSSMDKSRDSMHNETMILIV